MTPGSVVIAHKRFTETAVFIAISYRADDAQCPCDCIQAPVCIIENRNWETTVLWEGVTGLSLTAVMTIGTFKVSHFDGLPLSQTIIQAVSAPL